MRVTILSKIDYAGSGFRLCEAVRNQGVDAEAICLQQLGKYGIRTGKTVSEIGSRRVQQRIDQSDIIHIKGDWLYGDSWEGFSISEKKRVQTFCGSFFRRGMDKNVCMPIAPVSEYRANFLSAFTPELLYTKGIHLMEFPYNEFNYQFRKQKKFRIVHIPSSYKRKGSDVVNQALSGLNRNDVEVISLSNISINDVIELKKTASIYIDQMLLPVYGNAAVEAMALGIPVMNWDENYYPYFTPIIKPMERTPVMVKVELERYLNWDRLKQQSEMTFEYCKSIHGSMGKKWATIYNEIYG